MLPPELEQLIVSLDPKAQAAIRLILEYTQKILEAQQQQIEDQQKQIEELKAQLAKNSGNSGKPPSSDGLKKKSRTKSLRSKSGRRPGGQKGHEGNTLKMVEVADQIELHPLNHCPNCAKDLSDIAGDIVGKRQLFDLPPIKIQVTEHQIESKQCPCCQQISQSDFPDDLVSSTQYGGNILALGCYLRHYQMLPYERVCDLMQHLFGQSPSPGTLYNAEHKAYDQLENFEQELRKTLIESDVVGFDETGMRVNNTTSWLHTASTEQLALCHIDEKRGRQAMDKMGVLPDFDGIAVHDFFSSYFGYDCEHAACNAHLLRELNFVEEYYEQPWAKQLKALLLEAKKAKQTRQSKGKNTFTNKQITQFHCRYQQIIQQALQANPLKDLPVNNKGKPKKNKPRKLAERLDLYEHQVLYFIWNFDVPFDNNQSERDLRMAKVKQKVSGSFRSPEGAAFFARIRSYVLTAQKQGYYAYDALRVLFQQNFSLCHSLVRG